MEDVYYIADVDYFMSYDEVTIKGVTLLYHTKPFNETHLHMEYETYCRNRKNLWYKKYLKSNKTLPSPKNLSFAQWLKRYKGFKQVRASRVQSH